MIRWLVAFMFAYVVHTVPLFLLHFWVGRGRKSRFPTVQSDIRASKFPVPWTSDVHPAAKHGACVIKLHSETQIHNSATISPTAERNCLLGRNRCQLAANTSEFRRFGEVPRMLSFVCAPNSLATRTQSLFTCRHQSHKNFFGSRRVRCSEAAFPLAAHCRPRRSFSRGR